MKNLHTLDKYRLREDERRIYGINGDSGNGFFKVHVNGRSFKVIASTDEEWEHVIVSLWSVRGKISPGWEDMNIIKKMFFDPGEQVVQYDPINMEYIQKHPYCIHLWRATRENIPSPPTDFV